MKNLILNVLRTLWKRKLQISLLFILVFVAGTLYSFVETSLVAISEASDQFEENAKPEQFRYMISKSFSDAEISDMIARYDVSKADKDKGLDELVRKYGIDLNEYIQADNELLMKKYAFESEQVRKKYTQGQFNMKDCNFHIRVMQKNINTPIFIAGFQPYSEGEVAVSKIFAEQNGILRGTKITILGKDYIVSGTYIEPDEIFIHDTTRSADISTDTNAGILMLESDFDALDIGESSYYIGSFIKRDDNNIRIQVSNMSKERNIIFAAMSTEYQEVSILTTLQNSNSSLMIFGLILIFLILGFAIIIQISNQFREFRKSMGVLLALGVAKKKIAYSYSVYFFVFCFAMALGIVAGYFLSEIIVNNLDNMYNILISKPAADIPKYAIFTAVVTASLTLYVVILAYLETNRKPLNLIYASEKQKIGVLSRVIKKMISVFKFGTRIKISVALRRNGRLVTMLLTFFIAYNLLGMGIALNNLSAQVYSDYQKYIKYDHMDFYETIMNDASTRYREADVFIDESVKLVRNETTKTDINYTFTMEGIAQSQRSLGLRNDKLSEGIIISLSAASKHNISIGNELQFLIDGETHKYKVADINDTAIDNKIYINITEMHKLEKYNPGDFVGAYVLNSTSVKDALYSISSQDLINMSASFNESTTSVTGMLFILSIVVSMALIILVATFNFNDNVKHVTLLRFFGYTNRQSNSILINIFDPIAVIGCLMGAFTIPYLLTIFESIMLSASDYYVPFRATLFDRVLTAVVLLVVYQICKALINLVLKNRTTAKVLRV